MAESSMKKQPQARDQSSTGSLENLEGKMKWSSAMKKAAETTLKRKTQSRKKVEASPQLLDLIKRRDEAENWEDKKKLVR